MGGINDSFDSKKLSVKNIADFLNILIIQDPGKNQQNKKVLQEIGIINEYSYTISDKVSSEMIYYSKNNKIVEKCIFAENVRSNFVEWAKYLFDITNEDLDSIQQLSRKIDSIKKRTLTKEFFQNNIKKYLFKNKAFNKLLDFGIPNYLRFFIWDIVLSEKYNNQKYFNFEQELKEYKFILEKKKANPQIEKDINRTFMKEKEQTKNNIQILKNILYGINTYNASGYCQGMNFIVGYLLKLTNYDEVKTFYIFKSVLCDIKGYFEVGFPLLKKNNEAFNKMFKESYPKLFKHFQKHEIVNEFWIGKWFQTLFTLSLPFDELNMIWDVLLIRGFDFIIYICLALCGYIEKELLDLKDSAEIINYLDKVLNSQDNDLIQTKKQSFEDIDNYIIPLSDLLSEASELEKKIAGGNENTPYYDRRKSDSNMMTFKFNSLKNQNPGIISQNSKQNDITKSVNANNNNINTSILQNNNVQNPNYINPNNINNNRLNLENQKIPFYSTKNLGTYNFNDFPKKDNINLNSSINRNINMNVIPGQFQYINNNNINMPNNNFLKYYH